MSIILDTVHELCSEWPVLDTREGGTLRAGSAGVLSEADGFALLLDGMAVIIPRQRGYELYESLSMWKHEEPGAWRQESGR